jgi:cobalamin-dependent methionine synthase I
MLRYRGWEVLNLGSNVPIARLEETITETQPNLVILTAQLLITAATLMNVAHLLQHREELRVAYGGRIFALVPAIREKIPAHYLGDTFELAVQTAVTLMSQNPNEVEAVSVGVDYQQAYNQFRRNHSAIEARIWQSPEIERMSQEQITVSNTFMAQDILAALQLGDISLLGNEISWLEQYLEYANIDAGALHVYLQVYYQAAVEALGDNGHHVLTWLQQLLEPA